MESPEIIHCNKTERVIIHRIPNLNTTQGHYMDTWKDPLWEGGVKVTEIAGVIKITFQDKTGKVFAETNVPSNYKDALVKTVDSTRGYALRLEKPNGGFMWVGVVFRDRNDSFDFGVIFQDHSERQKITKDTLSKDFEDGHYALKKGEKIKINIGGSKKNTSDATSDFFGDFGGVSAPSQPAVKATTSKPADNDWFADFGTTEKPKASSQNTNLLDL